MRDNKSLDQGCAKICESFYMRIKNVFDEKDNEKKFHDFLLDQI